MHANAKASIKRGVDWLLKQQSVDDRGWHSDTYGAMRGGASSTSLVLYAASHLPAEFRKREAWSQGLQFLLRGLSKRNCIACPDGTLDYPTYSTAMTLVASRKLGLDIAKSKREKLVSYLVSAQLSERNGFKPEQVDYGGWDLIGGSGATGITSGTNISVSYHAVEAIAGETHAEKETVMSRAKEWCHRCQNLPPAGDGGFYFHPDGRNLGNKAKWTDDRYESPRSYGTATCDGLALLTAVGAKPDGNRRMAAVLWLVGRELVERVPGFEEDAEDRPDAKSDDVLESSWAEGLKFYYHFTLARVLSRLPEEERAKRSAALIEELLKLQGKDGSWQNDSARMREDDPLIATSFALTALSLAASD